MTPITYSILTLSALLFFTGSAAAQDRVLLKGSVPGEFGVSKDAGSVDPDTRITGVRLVTIPSKAQNTALEQLLEAQRDPASPDYHNWLTPEQYGERFGLSDDNLALISSWLQSSGFSIDKVARARNWIQFSGTAAQMAKAFHTELRHVEIPGETHFTNTTEIAIPAAVAGIIGDIRGLNDFRLKPLHVKSAPHPDFDASGGVHFLGPGDFATVYDLQPLYTSGFDGTGQRLAIAGQSDINLTDLRAFRAQFNLPAHDPQLVLVGPDPGTSEGDQTEASLDLEWSGAVARNATVIYVYSRNVFESLQYAIDENLAPVVSVSYGGCELQASTTYRLLAQQANAQGISWINAAGDAGAAGCDQAGEPQAKNGLAAAFPADIPEVTAVGGTEFNEGNGFYWQAQNNANPASAVSYIPEKAWDDSSLGEGICAGGGAPSQVYAKPWWQSGPGVPNDQARDVPDVALAASGAHDAYVMYFGGHLVGIGGTSAASPSFAGIVAILNQYLTAQGKISRPGLGNINPALYNLASNTTGIFHDIVTANNDVECAAGTKGCVGGWLGYSAGAGYDVATGLGSVDAYNLVTRWISVPAVNAAMLTLAATPASIAAGGSVQLTATLSVTSGGNAPAGSVTFTIGNETLGAANLVGSGSTETVTLTVSGSKLAVGANTITAAWAGNATFSSASATATVQVTAPAPTAPVATATTVSATPAAITSSGTSLITVIVKPLAGSIQPGGTVTLLLGNKTLAVASLVNAVAVMMLPGSGLAPGVNTLIATYSGSTSFVSSASSPFTITVAIATTTLLTAAPAAIPQSASTLLTATVTGQGIQAPSGSVQFSVGSNVLGTVPLTASGVFSAAALSVKGTSLSPGANTVIANYIASGVFSNSVASILVNVTVPPIATTTATTLTLTAAPGAQPSTTILTAIVKPAAGNLLPSGFIAFARGTSLLGTSQLTNTAGVATAAFTFNNSSLAAGTNTISAAFPGSAGFSASSGSVLVSIPSASTVSGKH